MSPKLANFIRRKTPKTQSTFALGCFKQNNVI